MASQSDRDRWLLDAADACGEGQTDEQVEWLRQRRAEYSEAAREGDWEHTQMSSDGGAATSRRGISDRDNHDAIVAALRYLGATEIGSSGALLRPVFCPGVG
jgi:hypothetical protein